jgi:WhiB family redox-sensing transcriptional regulator
MRLPSLPGVLALPLLPGALCKGEDPVAWFPVPGGSPARGKAVCAACPARRDCLDWALRAGEPAGIWGGTSPDERALIIRQRRRRQPGTEPAP